MASVAEPARVSQAVGPRKDGNEAQSVESHSRAAGFRGNETINHFLDRQPQQTLVRLYQRPANALAVFRLLSPMGRQLIMHLLFLDVPLATNDYLAWVRRGEGKRQHDAAVQRLERLHLLRDQGGKLILSSVFQESLQRALMGGGEHRSFGVPSPPSSSDGAQVDVAFLDEYARRSWEGILHYMVGSDGVPPPRDAVLFLLRQSNVMAPVEGSTRGTLGITSRGFQFLLEDVNTQLWDLLLQYLALADSRRMDLVEVLSLLFMLGSLTLGQAYSTDDLPETQLHCLEDFRDYGLVYQRRSGSKRFWPTRLATTLTSTAVQALRTSEAGSGSSGSGGNAESTTSSQQEQRGFIILETNYRLYAYTSNPLRIAVLQLFVHVRSRFPNLLIGVVTRESVKSALRKGISAEQIITYLSHHAHPQMHRNDPLLPITVTDQIRLWERERNRVQESEGYLYSDFTSQADYRLVRDYASSLSVLVWENEPKRTFFLKTEGHEPIKDFIRRRLQP
ncbi:unnamed protein product [Parajaminaea phylloscopi]